MSKQLIVTIAYHVPLDSLVSEETFKDAPFYEQASQLEEAMTNAEGIGFWPKHGEAVIQSARIKEIPDGE